MPDRASVPSSEQTKETLSQQLPSTFDWIIVQRDMMESGVRYLFIGCFLLTFITIQFVGGAEVPSLSSSVQPHSTNGSSLISTNHGSNASSPVALLTQMDSSDASGESLLDMLGVELDSSVSGRMSDGDVGATSTTTTDTYINQMVWDDDNIFDEVDYRNIVKVSDPSSHIQSESLPVSNEIENNVEANSTMTVVPTSSITISSPGITRIFGVPVSSFKGFGLTVEKSVVKWSACGMAIRVPISSHFPEYDKNQNLPRLSGSMGITYPYGYKVSVKAKFNIKSAVSGILSMLNSTGVRTAGDLYNAYKRQKASDSLQQFGATFTLHYIEKKLHFTVGPWVSYIPGLAVMTQHVLPVIFFLPAVVVALLGLFFPLSLMEEEVTQLWNDVLAAVEHESQHHVISTSSSTPLPVLSSISTIPTPGMISSSDSEHTTQQKPSSHSTTIRKTIKRTYVCGCSIRHWHQRLLEWGCRKTTGLGYDFGWKYKGLLDHHPSLGSRIYFEIGQFFPLAKSWKRFSTMTCDSFEWLANFLKNVTPSIRVVKRESPPIVSSPTAMSWHEDVLWLPEVSRLGGNIQTTKNRDDTTTTQNDEETAPRSPMILPPTKTAAANMVSSVRK